MADVNKHRVSVAQRHGTIGPVGQSCLAVETVMDTGMSTEGRVPVTAFVAPDDEGVTLELEAWSSFGQRATFSGAVSLDDVHVPDERILDAGPLPQHPGPTIFGAYDQIAHLAVDVGIARAALEDGVTFIRDRARPWFEADTDRVADEPHVLRRVGELTTRLHALEALFDRARATLDSTASAPALTDENAAAASLAVAEAKAFAQEVTLEIATGVLEFSRADRVILDERHRTATLVQSYNQPEGLTAPSQGNAQTTADGNLLVGWGSLPYLSEFARSGALLFNAEYPTGVNGYRAYTFPWPAHGDGRRHQLHRASRA
jgi:Acyl-CoA dehydrogenase, C-terminal domain